MSYSRTLTLPSLLHENHLNALDYTIFFLIAPELLRPLSFFSGVGCLFKGLSMSLRRFPYLCKRSLSVSVRAKPHLERGGGALPSLRFPRKRGKN